jgi:hypothetical protein
LQKKAERFRSMNYDPTLRNIKAKYLNKEEVMEGYKKSFECQVLTPEGSFFVVVTMTK